MIFHEAPEKVESPGKCLQRSAPGRQLGLQEETCAAGRLHCEIVEYVLWPTEEREVVVTK